MSTNKMKTIADDVSMEDYMKRIIPAILIALFVLSSCSPKVMGAISEEHKSDDLTVYTWLVEDGYNLTGYSLINSQLLGATLIIRKYYGKNLSDVISKEEKQGVKVAVRRINDKVVELTIDGKSYKSSTQ